MKGGLTGRMTLVSVALAAVVGTCFAILFVSIGNLRHSSQLAKHSEEVIATSNQYERLVLDLETGLRGYVITRQAPFLQPWTSARAQLPREAALLESLVRGTPAQERRARAIAEAALSYLHDYSEPLVARARSHPRVVAKQVASGEGKAAIDSLRAHFDRFVAAEEELSGARTRNSSVAAHRAVEIALGGLGASLLLIALFVLYLSRLVVVPVRRLAAAAGSLAHGDLSVRVPEEATAEIGTLARSFNQMAASLEESRDELENQNAELELQAAELEDQQARVSAANDELEAQARELARTVEAVEEERERLAVLYSYGEMLARETESGHLSEHVMREMADLVQADVGAIYIARSTDVDEPLTLATTRGIAPERVPATIAPGQGLAGRALAELHVIVGQRNDCELTVESLGGVKPPAHELHVPLLFGGRAIAVVCLGRLADRPFTPTECELLQHLAGQTAVAVSNKLAFRQARRLADVNGAVLDATTDGITLTNTQGEVVLQNAVAKRQMTDLLELPDGGTLGDYIDELAGRSADPDGLRTAHAMIAADPEHDGWDDVELLSGRSYRRYTAPVRSADGEHVGRLFVIRETTDERAVERLKTELVATVSHELRTPLASIMGFAELLTQRDYDTETRARFVSTIHSEAARLTGLVNDFLDLQRIEAGGFTLALEPFDLDPLVREEVELYSAQSEAHIIELEGEAQALAVVGERPRIAQVLGNLLTNAIKYSPDGGRVQVNLARRNGAVRVSVADQGIGIPEEQQAQVFTKFFRVDSSDRREIGGTGLGLAVCKEIVAAHGGRIGFTSREGEGSTFWFELPSATSAEGPRDGRNTVLVIEDDPHAASLLMSYLTEADYRVEVTPTGEDALKRVAAHPPAAICLDITLAGQLDGWAVLSQLKANPSTSSIPVVICTAGNGHADASALGAADFLAKPFSGRQLRLALERVLPHAQGSVLVVEDEENVRNLLVETLAVNGYELREAADGQEALERIAARPPDAIVLDLVLPRVDGFAVLERLQSQPHTRHIPVIVLTAKTLDARERTQLQRRAVDLLAKNTYSASELRALVERALGHS